MSSKDLSSNVKVVNAFNTQAISSDTTTNGNSIDLAGFESCLFAFQAGAVTAGDVTPLIEDSDNGSSFSAVDDTFLIGTEVAALLDAANEVSKIGYVGKKRYVRASLVSANSANLTVGGTAVLGDAHNAPVA